MAFFSGDTQKGCVQLLLSYVTICVIALVLLGCRRQTTDPQTMTFDTIPDKESYLLSQLNDKYRNPGIHSELGRFYLSQGETDKAKYHLETALSLDPSYRPAQAAYVHLTSKIQGELAAQRLCSEYQRPILASSKEMIKLAKALGDEGLDTLALGCFQRILSIDPGSAEANRQLGYFYLARNDSEKAKLYFSKSFELNPNQADVAGELGRLGVTIQTPGLPSAPVY